VPGFALSDKANIFVFMILYDFGLLPACFCYIILNVRNFESHLHIADRCTLRKTANGGKSLNNTIKINCHSAEMYRKMIAFMKEKNIIYHSYQPKNERPYKIVIKHLHHSVKLEDITFFLIFFYFLQIYNLL
jgi:hypothetical protein